MGIEFELKFTATPSQLQAVRAAFEGAQTHFQMETAYYDTPTGELSARHCTLRRRMENGRSVCTLKLPAAGEARQEFEVFAEHIEDAIPALCKLSGQEQLHEVISSGLVQVCGARFLRMAKILELDGCCVELALDEGILTGGGRQMPLCEIEVELKSGDPEAAVAFAQDLARQFGLQREERSKFCRALDLAKGESYGKI